MKQFGIQNIKFFGFICILGSLLLSQGATASAATPAAPALKVHVLDNLNAEEARFVRLTLKKMGYAPSNDSLFSVRYANPAFPGPYSNTVRSPRTSRP